MAPIPTSRNTESAVRRQLTRGEWQAASPGLAEALRRAGAQPCLEARAHPAAQVARLWRGAVPIMTLGPVIWWPEAPGDLSARGLERAMAVLQHELQHVLDFATGWLTAFRYVTRPHHWTYGWRIGPDTAWDTLGAEQRASMAERLWLMEHGLAPPDELAAVRRLVPWA